MRLICKQLTKCLEEKDVIILKLENRVSQLETNLEDKAKIQGENNKELEGRLNCLEINKPNTNLCEKVEDIEEKQNYLIEETNNKYSCNICSFTTYYRKSLKIHKKKMHTSHSCELCEEIFDTARGLKIHVYTHSYTTENKKEKCNTCDFKSTTIYTMEVHVGKCRQQHFECGLCEGKFDSLLKYSDSNWWLIQKRFVIIVEGKVPR